MADLSPEWDRCRSRNVCFPVVALSPPLTTRPRPPLSAVEFSSWALCFRPLPIHVLSQPRIRSSLHVRHPKSQHREPALAHSATSFVLRRGVNWTWQCGLGAYNLVSFACLAGTPYLFLSLYTPMHEQNICPRRATRGSSALPQRCPRPHAQIYANSRVFLARHLSLEYNWLFARARTRTYLRVIKFFFRFFCVVHTQSPRSFGRPDDFGPRSATERAPNVSTYSNQGWRRSSRTILWSNAVFENVFFKRISLK